MRGNVNKEVPQQDILTPDEKSIHLNAPHLLFARVTIGFVAIAEIASLYILLNTGIFYSSIMLSIIIDSLVVLLAIVTILWSVKQPYQAFLTFLIGYLLLILLTAILTRQSITEGWMLKLVLIAAIINGIKKSGGQNSWKNI